VVAHLGGSLCGMTLILGNSIVGHRHANMVFWLQNSLSFLPPPEEMRCTNLPANSSRRHGMTTRDDISEVEHQGIDQFIL